MDAYWPMIKNTLEMFLFLGGELSILFILISAGVSLAQQYIPDTKIQAMLGGTHGRGYLLAAGLGAITPFCSCSTIPMLRGLLRAKAGFGPTLTFLFSSPLLNPIIIGLFFATFGIKVTVFYSIIALAVSIVAGFILDKMHYEKYVIPEKYGASSSSSSSCCSASAQSASSCCSTVSQTASSCCSTTPQEPSSCCSATHLEPLVPVGKKSDEAQSCCGSGQEQQKSQEKSESSCCSAGKVLEPLEPMSCSATEAQSSCCGSSGAPIPKAFSKKVAKAMRDGWNQFIQVCPYLLLGVSLGAIIYGFVPGEFIAKYASGDNIFAVPVAAMIGIPLYVRVEALIPLTAVLVEKGMGLGAVMALIVGGGGASITEVILLKSMFKMPMIIAFLTVILGMAIMTGYMFQFIL